jgi:hypothetical protein
MSRASMVGTAYINGGTGCPGQIVIEREVEFVTSALPRPDERWSFVDSAGHFHAYDQSTDARDRYPTLKTRVEEIPCSDPDHDSDCDGANITHWHCRLCDEETEPGLVHGEHTVPIYGRYEWSAKVGLPPEDAIGLIGEQVSFRFEIADGTQMFGIAMVHGGDYSSDQPRMTVDLISASQLGRSKDARRAVPA